MLPNEFVKKYQELLGDQQAQRLFDALTKGKAKKGFRLNPLKTEFSQVQYPLDHPIREIPNAYYGSISGHDSEWTGGYVYSQDPSAMVASRVLKPLPGEKVLDLCAAPGGKSTSLGEQLQGKGLLVANEISRKRAKSLRENLERWGLTNVLLTNETPARLAQKFPDYFDKILVDAPCSGEGMFRKDPDAMTYWSNQQVQFCQTRQKEILTEAFKMLRPGGRLVYATCTFSPEEDEKIVLWLLQQKNLELVPIETSLKADSEWEKDSEVNLPRVPGTLRFWPQDGFGEGQFVAMIQKRANEGKSTAVLNHQTSAQRHDHQNSKERLTSKERSQISDQLALFNFPEPLKSQLPQCQNSHQHIFIPVIPPKELTGLHVLSNGVELGLLKPGRFEPSHQLAEVLGQCRQNQVYDLNDQDYQRYIGGEALSYHGQCQGYLLIRHRNHIFSFGKAGHDGILKNFYPKGLRQK